MRSALSDGVLAYSCSVITDGASWALHDQNFSNCSHGALSRGHVDSVDLPHALNPKPDRFSIQIMLGGLPSCAATAYSCGS